MDDFVSSEDLTTSDADDEFDTDSEDDEDVEDDGVDEDEDEDEVEDDDEEVDESFFAFGSPVVYGAHPFAHPFVHPFVHPVVHSAVHTVAHPALPAVVPAVHHHITTVRCCYFLVCFRWDVSLFDTRQGVACMWPPARLIPCPLSIFLLSLHRLWCTTPPQ